MSIDVAAAVAVVVMEGSSAVCLVHAETHMGRVDMLCTIGGKEEKRKRRPRSIDAVRDGEDG